MSDLSTYSVHNPKQIVSYLSLLIKNKSLLTASFGDGNESYITTLLDIHEKDKAVILDCGSKESLNQHLLRASKISFTTDFHGIEVSFVGSGLKKTTYKGSAAFSMPFPKSLFWMERREYYRVKAPLSKASHCQLGFENMEPVNLKLHDISLSGFSMLNTSKEISEAFETGTIFEQSKLILAGIGEGMISFEVRYELVINPEKPQKIQKIGCKFINITRAVEDNIQRYMQQVQREELQKEQAIL